MEAAASMASKLGLPPGFRFEPNDKEVVAHYLIRRIRDQPLPPGDILEDDPLSAPPWLLLAKHGRKGDAFFFGKGQAMNGKGTRQKRSCAGGGTWEGQGKRKGGEAKKLRVRVGGEEIEWRKYALNFHEQGVNGSTGWVMHEYSITAPPDLAASPVRVYRIRFSGRGKNAKKRKKNEVDWASDEEEEVYQGAAALPDALFVGGCPPAAPQPEPVSYLPVPVVAESDALFVGGCPPAPQLEPVSYLPAPVLAESDALFVVGCPSAPQPTLAEWTGDGAGGAISAATSSSDQDLSALLDGGENWNNFMFSLDDFLAPFDFSGAADAGDISSPMVPPT